jgi:hypothetical protein
VIHFGGDSGVVKSGSSEVRDQMNSNLLSR